MPSRAAAGKSGSGGRADVRRAVVPENGEPADCVVRASVVRVQRAAVAQLQIGFRHAQPPVPGTDREDPHTLSLRLCDADATDAQIVYGIPHSLPSTRACLQTRAYCLV